MSYNNRISKILFAVGIIFFIIAFFTGIVQASQISYYVVSGSEIWVALLLYWFGGFALGMFFIALAEIIEQLSKLNGKIPSEQGEQEKSAAKSIHSESLTNDEDESEPGDGRTPTAMDYQGAWMVTIGIFIVLILIIIFANSR
ncbi:hypothetical protein [Evansella tamaricis]|uniref:Uncharacterized protein n=1 Tax=Evansella tamaricis TaxID=2069301 RepID=A0ABS6JDR1_9BACI|nr:hypothetical protein [Evansella tamaricis]MBU9711540.1 hypothetical protein [Evansella tamaricis]